MRDDFNKQLTERERIGHKMKFGDYRNAKLNKSLDEDMSGGKESIHARRRNAKGSNKARKQFNENLNPLKNFLRVNLGRPWDKIYSEITQNFDKRKVINNHILEHLFQYVELEVYIIDGKPHTLSKYRYSREEYSPITYSPRYPTYYVDPRDGLLKTPKQDKTRRQRDREDELETKKKQEAVYRKIDDNNHLILKNGIWWVYTAKNKPAKVMEYNAPYFRDYEERKAWNLLYESQLTEEAKQKLMVGKLVDGPMPDALGTPTVPGFADGGWYSRGPSMIPKDKYFYSRKAASHKILKQAGIDGMIPDAEPPRLSHRQASKYRNKKKEVK